MVDLMKRLRKLILGRNKETTMAITFESYERRIKQIEVAIKKYGIKDLEEAQKLCLDKKQKHFVCSLRSIAARFPCPSPTKR